MKRQQDMGAIVMPSTLNFSYAEKDIASVHAFHIYIAREHGGSLLEFPLLILHGLYLVSSSTVYAILGNTQI